jgi:glycosyltransferase involved in cell wall biosynthesis
MSPPLVVVVTPVYNGAEFIAETMESVQAQTWPNLIHLVLDNNSSDGTGEIVERYRNGRVPLQVFRNETTLPILENWNTAYGMVPAEAAYVRILCADDTITPDSIEEMVKLGEAHPEVGVIGCLHWCDGGVGDFLWPAGQEVFDGEDAIRRTILREGILMPVQMMMRKSVSDQRKPLFQPMPGLSHDLVAMMDLLTWSKFGFVHKELGFTRVHDGTMSAQNADPKTGAWTSDGLFILRTFGEKAFGPAYREHLLRFRRYYVRRILAWRRRDPDLPYLPRHYQAIREAGWRWGPGLISDAVIDGMLNRIGVRRSWTGFPGWQ